MNNPDNILTNFNRKQGADIFTFSLPRNTCLAHKTPLCFEKCYGRRKVFVTKCVLGRYIENLADSKDPDFEGAVIEQITRDSIDFIRVHTIGDFYNQSYFDKWIRIARLCPATRFLAYTRNWELDASNLPENFVIFYSEDPTTTHFNPTLARRSIMFYPPREVQVYKHLDSHAVPGFRVCSSTCNKCKVCWIGKFNMAFPIITSIKKNYKAEKIDYYHLPKRKYEVITI